MPFLTNPAFAVREVNNVTGIRAYNVEYTNLTGRTMFVHTTHILTFLTEGDNVLIQSLVGGINQGNVGIAGYPIPAAPLGSIEEFALDMIVPPGVTYQLVPAVAGTGTAVLQSWFEAL